MKRAWGSRYSDVPALPLTLFSRCVGYLPRTDGSWGWYVSLHPSRTRQDGCHLFRVAGADVELESEEWGYQLLNRAGGRVGCRFEWGRGGMPIFGMAEWISLASRKNYCLPPLPTYLGNLTTTYVHTVEMQLSETLDYHTYQISS